MILLYRIPKIRFRMSYSIIMMSHFLSRSILRKRFCDVNTLVDQEVKTLVGRTKLSSEVPVASLENLSLARTAEMLMGRQLVANSLTLSAVAKKEFLTKVC